MGALMFFWCFAVTPVIMAFGFYQLNKDEPRPFMHRALVYGVCIPAIGLLALAAR